MAGRFVDTAYGPVPGCPDCGVWPAGGPHVCEHGVTPALAVEMTFTAELDEGQAAAWWAALYVGRAPSG